MGEFLGEVTESKAILTSFFFTLSERSLVNALCLLGFLKGQRCGPSAEASAWVPPTGLVEKSRTAFSTWLSGTKALVGTSGHLKITVVSIQRWLLTSGFAEGNGGPRNNGDGCMPLGYVVRTT